MFKQAVFGILVLGICSGCVQSTSESQKNDVSTVAVASASAPPLGTDDWFVWVEKTVGTGDGAGHGPDYGSQEWCLVVNKKLFKGESTVSPCSPEWERKVTDTLLSKK